MNEKKNIDKLFKEQLKNFEVAPEDYVWKNIEDRLHEDKRKKRRIIPIWWKFAGIAAGLVLLFTVANQVFDIFDNDGVSKDIIVDESNINDNSKSQNSTLEQNDPLKVILENDATDQVVNTKSKTSVEDEESSMNKNKSNIISSDNIVNPVIASESSNRENSSRKKLKEKTKNSIATNTGDYKKSIEEKEEINQKHLTKYTIATKASSKTNLKKQNSITNNDSKKLLEEKKKTNQNPSTKDAVASTTKASSKTNQNIQNTIKDKSEIDTLLKSTENSTTVAYVNMKEKEASKKENSEIKNNSTEDPQNKEKKEEGTNAIENAIAEAEETEEEEEEEEEEELNKWSVSPNVAPVYFSSLGKGSPLDNQFVENTKEPEINMSYGIKGRYTVNKKFKIRVGINKVQLGYKTKDVLIFENINPVPTANRQIANVNLVDSMSQHSIYSAKNFKFDNAPATLFTKEQGSLDQQLGFIEVPIEIEYNLIESKLGLNLIGGFSALFLSDNDVYAVLDNGDRTRLGEATNVKDLSYTANFGIGIDYNFSKQFQFNLDPTFKYQINTFNNTSGNFKPFFIGVYTGFSFKF